MNKLRLYTLDQIQDKLIGEKGTPERDSFEDQLQVDFTERHPANPPRTTLNARRIGQINLHTKDLKLIRIINDII